MFLIDTDTAVNVMPAPAAPGAPGWFTGGNPGPGTPVPATNFSPDWCNGVQGELLSILTAAGIAPDKTKINQVLTAIQKLCRTSLTANTTFYVAPTGNDGTGDGSVGAPWATVTHAYNVLLSSYNLNGFTATIQVADGVYAGVQTLSGALSGQGGPANLIINGNAVTPANVVMALAGLHKAAFQPQNMKIANAAGDGVSASFGASIIYGIGLVFGVCTQSHMTAFRTGTITRNQNYTINGNASWHMESGISGTILSAAITVTLTGTPAFSTAFAQAAQASCVTDFTTTYTGAATGVRYLATECGVISTNGGGANYFPGNSAGSFATGGQYS